MGLHLQSLLDVSECRWRFTCKVYFIITIQLLVTTAVVAKDLLVPSIAHLFTHSIAELGVFIAIAAVPFIVQLYVHCIVITKLRPVNYLLLGILTAALGFLVGLTCSFTSGNVIMQSAILTSVATLILTLHTFWAARRGYDFKFVGPLLFAALIALLLFALIQIFIPLGRILLMIYGCLASILFCGYVVYDTDKRQPH